MKKLWWIGIAAALSMGSSMAESRRKASDEEASVQRAIAFQRAKDRADARQARKEARHPKHFEYAPPQNNRPNSLATEQKKDAVKRSPRTGDREAPPK